MLTLFQTELYPVEKSKAANRQLVAILGGSLLMDGVEAGLNTVSNLDVIHVPEGVSNPIQYLKALSPDIILFDWDCPDQGFILPYMRLNPETLIFGLDLSSHKVTHLSGQLYSVYSTNGLLWLIDQKSKRNVNVNSPVKNNGHHIQIGDLVEGILLAYTQPD